MSFKKTALALATAGALAAVSSVATAAPNNNLYLGLDAQHWNVDFDNFDDFSSMSVRLRGGMTFSEYVGVEVHLGLGGDDSNTYAGGTFKTELDYMLSSFVKGTLPVTHDFRLYGLAGLTYLNMTESVSNAWYAASANVDDTNFAAGVGLEFDITPHIAIGGDFIRHSFGGSGYDFDTMSAGVTYRF